jgi:hypothetical protein
MYMTWRSLESTPQRRSGLEQRAALGTQQEWVGSNQGTGDSTRKKPSRPARYFCSLLLLATPAHYTCSLLLLATPLEMATPPKMKKYLASAKGQAKRKVYQRPSQSKKQPGASLYVVPEATKSSAASRS